MYDPKIGRFLSPDPLLEMFPEQTPYQYAFNSPLIWKDPSGLKGEKERGDRMMGMETLLLQIANFFVDVARNLVDNSNKKCKCFDTRPCPCSNDNEGGGGSSGSSGGAPVALNNLEGNINSGRLASDGNLFRSDYKGDGGTGLEKIYLNSFERVVANWSSLSANQAVAVRNALQIIYYNGGKEVIDDLISTGHTVNIDFSFSSIDMMNHWNGHCISKPDEEWPPIAGMSSFKWNLDCISIKPKTSCDNPHFINGNIYLAIELVEGKEIENNIFISYRPILWGFIQHNRRENQKVLWMVLSHEIKHAFDSYNCHGPIDIEKSANRFMIDIWNRIYAPYIYDEKERW